MHRCSGVVAALHGWTGLRAGWRRKQQSRAFDELPRRQLAASTTVAESIVPVLTPSRAIDSIVIQFSRKIFAASLALSAWIVRLHARLVPLLANWK
jgi:hypothetical protein